MGDSIWQQQQWWGQQGRTMGPYEKAGQGRERRRQELGFLLMLPIVVVNGKRKNKKGSCRVLSFTPAVGGADKKEIIAITAYVM